MFGYVVPFKEELRIKEYNTFRAYYCGLCNEMGSKCYLSKFTLTYDMTFLSIILSSLYADVEKAYNVFCPYKMKKIMRVEKNPYIDYAADMNIILSNRKLIDNYIDEKNYLSLITSKIIRTNKLSDVSSSKLGNIDLRLKQLSKLEKLKCDSIDETSHAFAELTSDIFNMQEDSNSKLLKHLGYNIGKWIYILDAYDDLIEDIKKTRYNPCIYNFKYNGDNPVKFKDKIKDNIEFVLIRCLSEVVNAFDLLELRKNKDIIENIIYLGMENKTSRVLEGRNENEKSLRNIRCKTGCITGGNKAGI